MVFLVIVTQSLALAGIVVNVVGDSDGGVVLVSSGGQGWRRSKFDVLSVYVCVCVWGCVSCWSCCCF